VIVFVTANAHDGRSELRTKTVDQVMCERGRSDEQRVQTASPDQVPPDVYAGNIGWFEEITDVFFRYCVRQMRI
jgi:hypothetical protein